MTHITGGASARRASSFISSLSLSLTLSLVACLVALPAAAQVDVPDPFRQLEEILPTANVYRTASGAPGHRYWQQKVDYRIDVEIDDENQRLIGSERITYQNNSPDVLRYLWLQLDANLFRSDSDAVLTQTTSELDRLSFRRLESMMARLNFDGGVVIDKVTDRNDEPLSYTVVKTMMRVDLPGPLASGDTTEVEIDWSYAINDSRLVRGRTGFEYFEDDDNYLYEIAQWFPRLAAYTDANGWQNKQFIGSGEFTLELGDYNVAITVPADHIVASTGVLENPREVLTAEQRSRFAAARTAKEPIFIVTPQEAKSNETSRATKKKTWRFSAERVRDFAFATSRKFIWDAQGHVVPGSSPDDVVMAMSFYPNEGEPLWSRYSTHAIIHTLNVYSRYTFDYPYPVAISVNGPVGGMEYPMICFNGPRPEEDGTYSARTKYGLISVIIHEVGHNYFPMIVNSDERQWTWMDEGLNTFLQYLSEQEWEENYPSRRGEPAKIVGYTGSARQSPIMTNSESVLRLGPNAYAKPATALNILRETILGRELFDYAFKEYSRRWKFKRPQPADLFRTLEDASAIDLDWFWRAWFYSTGGVDLAVTGMRHFEIDTQEPDRESDKLKAERDDEPITLSKMRNAELPRRTDTYPELLDFYNEYDELDATDADRKDYEEMLIDLSDDERAMLASTSNFTIADFENPGGVVMPLILELEFVDGSTEEMRIPAEIWRRDASKVSKLLVTEQPIVRITVDPHLETADVDLDNNVFPPQPKKSRFELFKSKDDDSNPMSKARDAHEAATESEGETDDPADDDAAEDDAAEGSAGGGE